MDQEGALFRAGEGSPGEPVQRSIGRDQDLFDSLQALGQRFPQQLPQLQARVRFPGQWCLASAVAGSPAIDPLGQGLRRPERDDHHLLPLGPDHERHHPLLCGWLGLSLRRGSTCQESTRSIKALPRAGPPGPHRIRPGPEPGWCGRPRCVGQLPLQFIAFGGQGPDLVRHVPGIGLRLRRPVVHRQADDLPGDLAEPVQEAVVSGSAASRAWRAHRCRVVTDPLTRTTRSYYPGKEVPHAAAY